MAHLHLIADTGENIVFEHTYTYIYMYTMQYVGSRTIFSPVIADEGPQAAETIEVESSTRIDINDLICKIKLM